MSDITAVGVPGLPEITPGADLGRLISEAAPDLRDGDIVVVTSKIISKAEGRVVRADRERAIDDEAVRVVARRGPTRIAETRHGLVLAAAGVDASNTAPGTVVLLPEDPDGSARRLRKALGARRGINVGVVITDTMGRPWRIGQTDAAIGVETTAIAVAAHYGAGLLDGWLVDDQDKAAVDDPRLAGIAVRALPLYMTDLAASAEIARAALSLAAELTR